MERIGGFSRSTCGKTDSGDFGTWQNYQPNDGTYSDFPLWAFRYILSVIFIRDFRPLKVINLFCVIKYSGGMIPIANAFTGNAPNSARMEAPTPGHRRTEKLISNMKGEYTAGSGFAATIAQCATVRSGRRNKSCDFVALLKSH